MITSISMFDRFRSWARGDEIPTTEDFHFVPSSSLQSLIVSTEVQAGAAFQGLLHQTAVYRGVQMLTDLVASVPWFGFSGGDPSLTQLSELRRPERLEFQPRILLSPNPFETRDATIRKYVESLLWHGNAYVRGALFVEGRPTVIEVLDPNEVVVTPSEANKDRAVYQYRGTSPIAGVNFWHQKLVTVPGSLVGISPLTAGMPVITGGIAADKFARDMFLDSGIPTGKLTTPGSLTKDEAELLVEQWTQARKDRGTAVLSGGVDYSAIQLTPEQAQYLQTRAFTNQDVARLLGIPQWLLNAGSPPGSGSSLTYQNLGAVFEELVRATLDPTYFRRLEVLFSIFLPRGQMVHFDTDELIRSDREGRFRAWDTALSGQPFMTKEEVRAREGLDPRVEVPNDPTISSQARSGV